MKWLAFAIVLAFAAGFGMLALGHYLQVQEAREVWSSGKVTEGTLVEQVPRRRTYTYTYRVGGSELTAERRSVPYAAREIPVGAKLVVRYDPARPEKSVTPAELQAWESWGNRALLPAMALGLLGFGVWLVLPRKKKPPPA